MKYMDVSRNEFVLFVNLSAEGIEILLDRIYHQCTPKPMSAMEMLRGGLDHNTSATTLPPEHDVDKNLSAAGQEMMRYLPTGLSSLDRLLRGGIRFGSISEFLGRSGVGKTQLALQLCVMAVRYNQGAVYVDTEKKLMLSRLREMSAQRNRRQQEGECINAGSVDRRIGKQDEGMMEFTDSQQYGGNTSNQKGNGRSDLQQSAFHNGASGDFAAFKSPECVLNNLTVHQPGSTDELLGLLNALEDEVLHRNQLASQADSSCNSRKHAAQRTHPVCLLIVDSIAAPIRRDFGTDSAPQRAEAVFQCAQTLKRLADQLNLAVIVINQIGAINGTSDHDTSAGSADAPDPLAVRAALGTSWHHCVSTRLLLDVVETPSPLTVMHQRAEDENPWESLVHSNPESVRRVSIVKSNLTSLAETQFEISSLGIVEALCHVERTVPI
jgi:RecA/RadA recombinase